MCGLWREAFIVDNKNRHDRGCPDVVRQAEFELQNLRVADFTGGSNVGILNWLCPWALVYLGQRPWKVTKGDLDKRQNAKYIP